MFALCFRFVTSLKCFFLVYGSFIVGMFSCRVCGILLYSVNIYGELTVQFFLDVSEKLSG